MVKQNGLGQIARYAPVLKILHGSVRLLEQTTSIHGPSVVIKVSVTERPACANASLVMMVLPANVLSARSIAITVEPASQKKCLLKKQDEFTSNHGTQ